jgi:hypothetical protein
MNFSPLMNQDFDDALPYQSKKSGKKKKKKRTTARDDQ